VRARVEVVLGAGTACWCPLVRLELWNGAGGERERKVLREFERLIPDLAIDVEVWSAACELARRCRAAGVTVPATDLLIAACARRHGARIEHADADFNAIGGLEGGGDV
jgi:predicted nucleic acid-binding protein